jgi:hypothetical protein
MINMGMNRNLSILRSTIITSLMINITQMTNIMARKWLMTIQSRARKLKASTTRKRRAIITIPIRNKLLLHTGKSSSTNKWLDQRPMPPKDTRKRKGRDINRKSLIHNTSTRMITTQSSMMISITPACRLNRKSMLLKAKTIKNSLNNNNIPKNTNSMISNLTASKAKAEEITIKSSIRSQLSMITKKTMAERIREVHITMKITMGMKAEWVHQDSRIITTMRVVIPKIPP